MPRNEPIDIVPKQEVEALYRDFTTAFDKLADLYFGDPRSLEKYVEMTSDPYLRLVKREPLYESLYAFNESLGAPAAVLDNIRTLRRDGSYVVLVWQHPYLLGGPFETFLKCSTALLLCKRLNERGEGNFIPVVWAETDFAGLDEVNRAVLVKDGRLVTEALATEGADRPAIDVATGEAYDALLDRLRATLAETPHSAWLFGVLERSKGRDLGEHFCRFMLEAFGEHGLVVATPAQFRPQTATLIARAIENPEQTKHLVEGALERIRERGYPTDYMSFGDPLAMHLTEGGERRRLIYRDGAFHVDGTSRSFAPSELARELKAHPERFSTGLLMSPIAQDYCLPCVAHIAGPGGVAFFAMQKALFDTLYVAFPQVMPQISATFIDGPSERALKALGKTLVDLLAAPKEEAGEKAPDDRAILAGLAKEVEGAVAAHREAARARARELCALGQAVERAVRAEADKVRAAAPLAGEDERARAAFARFAEKARAVSDEAAAAASGLADRLAGALVGVVERPALAKARAALLEAAKALAAAAEDGPDGGLEALGKELPGSLARLASDALAARDRARQQGATPPLESVKTLLAPNDGLQEDTIWTIHFLNERGPGLFEATLAHLDPFDFRHQVLYLDG